MHVVAQALKSDLEDVQRLDADVYGEDAYSYMILRQFLDITGELFQICKDDAGNVIAYGIIAPTIGETSGWLVSLAVSPSHRRKGVGTRLIGQLLDIAHSFSLMKVYLTVAPGNRAAISLYERLGFRADQVEFHYFGQNEDRMVMCRPLGG